MTFQVPDTARNRTHPTMGTSSLDGNNGVFEVGSVIPGWMLVIIASDGHGWEHVSVRAQHTVGSVSRAPTWGEMCAVKQLFWGPDDCVVQYHPPEQHYVNTHPHVLHLWRPIGVEMPRPPTLLV